MRKFITINASKFPLVVARCKPFTPSLDELADAQMDVEKFARSHNNFVLVVDLTDLHFVPSEYRNAQARWSEKTEHLFASQNMRLAFYTPSSIARIMLKGVFLIRKPSVPHVVMSSLEQAVAWGQKQMALKNHKVSKRKLVNIDINKFPLVVARYLEFAFTAEEFHDTQLELENFAQHNRDYVIIIDLTHLASMPYEYRLAQAKWLTQNSRQFIKQNMKIAYCEPSFLAQIILKGWFLLFKPGILYTIVKSIDQGLDWGAKQLASQKKT